MAQWLRKMMMHTTHSFRIIHWNENDNSINGDTEQKANNETFVSFKHRYLINKTTISTLTNNE